MRVVPSPPATRRIRAVLLLILLLRRHRHLERRGRLERPARPAISVVVEVHLDGVDPRHAAIVNKTAPVP